MSYRLFTTGKASALFGESRVIQANEAHVFADAAQLLAHAAATFADAEEAREKAIFEGRQEGRDAVLAERDAFVAERLANVIADLEKSQAKVRQDIGALALEALRHIVGELPQEIAVAGLIEQALAQLAIETIDCIAIAPSLATPVTERLDDELAALVSPDPELGPSDCVIHAKSGRVIASLDLQLERLAERWAALGSA
ncbi:MAG: FliH/SctL family protein [Pseudomonadota bacterium]